MIDYKDFVIPEFYWDYFVREKKSLFINSYLKDNNILPSEDMIKNFIIEEKEREDFRRMLYSKYCISGVMPDVPNVPVLPDNPITPNNPKPEYDLDSKAIICTYNLNETSEIILFRCYSDNKPKIKKVVFNGKNIELTWSNNSEYSYDFKKLGDVTIEIYLEENINTLDGFYFGRTRLTEIIIPSHIIAIHTKDTQYIFTYSSYNEVFLNKIISLNKNAPEILQPLITYSYGSAQFQKGTLYVPKNCAINYSSWMHEGRLADFHWDIKELDY